MITKSPKETQKFAENFAKKILKRRSIKGAAVLGLIGDLGGGKTTFLQGFARGLGIKNKILSPTFVIMKKYEVRSMKKRRKRSLDLHTSYFILHTSYFYHVDCYRIKKPKEILDLGWKEIINNPQNIVAVEWADRISKIMPKDTIWIRFEFVDKKTRKITIRSSN